MCVCVSVCVCEEGACVGVQRRGSASDTQQRKIPTKLCITSLPAPSAPCFLSQIVTSMLKIRSNYCKLESDTVFLQRAPSPLNQYPTETLLDNRLCLCLPGMKRSRGVKRDTKCYLWRAIIRQCLSEAADSRGVEEVKDWKRLGNSKVMFWHSICTNTFLLSNTLLKSVTGFKRIYR